jgi:pseudoazurin
MPLRPDCATRINTPGCIDFRDIPRASAIGSDLPRNLRPKSNTLEQIENIQMVLGFKGRMRLRSRDASRRTTRIMIKRFLLAAMLMVAVPAFAAEHRVEMRNAGTDGQTMVFEPAVVFIQPGDTVVFVPTDKGHNAQTERGMIPAGAEAFKTKFNEEASIEFTVPGVYGISCQPHRAMGMVMTIVVGDDISNLDALKAVNAPGKSKERFAAQFAEVEAFIAGGGSAAAAPDSAAAEPAGDAGGALTPEMIATAKTNYEDFCAGCHASNAAGDIGPGLRGNSKLADGAFVLKQLTQGGSEMPGFGDTLSHEELVALSTYIRTNFGNDFGPLSAAEAGAAN